MRIAVSGTHRVGKSTLIDEFLRVHPEFAHEPEPYTVLVEDFGEEFSAEPSMDDFARQLEFNIDRLQQRPREERVIFERCPIDFLAYISALDSQAVQTLLGPALQAMHSLDLLVYLPLDETATTDAEFPKLRSAVDRRIREMISDNDYPLLEATGSTAERLRMIEQALS